MKSVIMIAYHFPPEGNAGATGHFDLSDIYRSDWQPTVITLKTDFYERYDPSLLSLVPNYIEVIRVAGIVIHGRHFSPGGGAKFRRSF